MSDTKTPVGDMKGDLPVHNAEVPQGAKPKYGKHKKIAGVAAACYLAGSAFYYAPMPSFGFMGANHGHHGPHGRHGHGPGHRPEHHAHGPPHDPIEGPFYLPDQLVRSDIAEDRVGVPLILQIEVVDKATALPVDNVAVDLWQADASGKYSGARPCGGRKHKGMREGKHNFESKDDTSVLSPINEQEQEFQSWPAHNNEERPDENVAQDDLVGDDSHHEKPAPRDGHKPHGPPPKEGKEHHGPPPKDGKGPHPPPPPHHGGHHGPPPKDGKGPHPPPPPPHHGGHHGPPPKDGKGPYPPPPPHHGGHHGPPPKDGKGPHPPPPPPHHGGHRGPPPKDGKGPHPPPPPPPHHGGPRGPPPKHGRKHNETSSSFEKDAGHKEKSKSSWLRGVQQTSEDGKVLFSTIFPAPDHHRASHIHYKLHAPVDETFNGRFHNMDTHELMTGQLFFDDSLVAEILNLAEYGDAADQIQLRDDFIYNGQGLISDVAYVNEASIESGITAKVTLRIDASEYVQDEFTDSGSESESESDE